MRSRIGAWSLALAALASGSYLPASAAEYDVPSMAYATIQDAVNDAALSVDTDNFVNLVASPIVVHDVVNFGVAFNSSRRVVVRPGPGLERATIASDNPSAPIIRMSGFGAGFVTLQDLDIVRNITNNNHLVVLSQYSDVVIERCRIGSIWTTSGTPGWSNLDISYPYDVVVRNCIFFAYTRGTFDQGIHAFSFNDPDNDLLLYNNVVADHRLYGIRIEAAAPASLVLLRNNVVSNHPDYAVAAEPVSYRSEVPAGPLVVSSHNVALAGPGHIETFGGGGVQSIAGVAASFINQVRPAVDLAFVERAWDQAPAWDPNPDFFRLELAGPLHDQNSDWGQTVANGSPDPRDVAVVDDIEKDGRPGGAIPHTDRGADQVDAAMAGVEPPLQGELWAAPRANPARAVEVNFLAGRRGWLIFEAFDLAGRRLFGEQREVAAGERGIFGGRRSPAGIVHFSLTLVTPGFQALKARGRIVVLP